MGQYFALAGGIICLFVFPPIGLFFTGFAIVASIREGRKFREEKSKIARKIRKVRESMPVTCPRKTLPVETGVLS